MKYQLLIFLLLPYGAFSQNTFQKTYCQSLTNDPNAWSITQTYDDGYVAVGFVDNGTSIDGIIVKTDSSGQLLWSKRFPSIQVLLFSVIETSDSGLIVTGEDYVYLMLLKTDRLGNILWQKSYNNTQFSEGFSVKELSDDGLIVIGVSDVYPTEDIFVLRTDKLGNIVWAKAIGGNNGDYGRAVQQCPDGGFILAGSTNSFGSGLNEGFLIKLDSAGTIQWGRTYVNNYPYFSNFFLSLTVDIDGGFVLLGNFDNNISAPYIGILKTDSMGNVLWNKFYEAGGTHLSKTSDGGFIITGGSTGSAFLMKADANGDVIWSRDLPGGVSHCVESTYDSGFITAAYDFQFTKTDQYGSSGCNQAVFFNPVSDTIYGINRNFSVLDGATSSISLLSTVTISGENTICSSLGSWAFQETPGMAISPNPASDKLTVESKQYSINSIELYNILGNKLELFRQSIDSPKHEVVLEISNLTPGMYVVKIQTEFGTGIKKIIVE